MGLQTTTITDFRKDIKSYVDEVIDEHETIIIPRSNKKGVVVISLAEYNSMMETAHLLSSPKNANRLRESIAQARNGEVIEKDLVE
jgi:antitoxin YefM